MTLSSPCPDEDALIAFSGGEVQYEAHIDRCDRCRAAVAMLAAMAVDDSPPAAAGRPLLARRFELGEPLGAGGLGLVVAARDHLLDADVAIKWLRPDRPRSDDRLADEVRLARRIRHPNVCAVFDLGRDGERRFITMERVHGAVLPAWIESQRPGRSSRRALMRAIVDGVAAAHRCGVVHRDLKPDNVMVDTAGQARVMDFGLATEAIGGDSGPVGTPRWWAPEHYAGRPATPRSDVFALGRIAEWLLPDATPATRRWIRRCLADDPAARFADATTLRRSIRTAPARRWVGWAVAAIALALGLAWFGPRPADPPGLERGITAISRNQMSSGVAQLKAAIREAPDRAVAHLWLGYAYSWLGQSRQARVAIDEALLKSEQLAEGDRLFLLALNARLQHDGPRAQAMLDRLLVHAPDHAAGRFTRADLDYHAGRFAEAAERLEPIVGDQPHNARAWTHLMWARMASEGAAAAEHVVARWLEASPGQVALEAHATLRVAVGAHALPAIEAAQRARTQDADPPTLRAILHLAVGRPTDAVASLQRFVDGTRPNKSNHADGIRRLGWVHLASGSFPAAARAYDTARSATAGWLPSQATAKAGFGGTLAAELAWGLAAMGGPPPRQPAGDLARQPGLLADRHAARYIALACLIRDDHRCLEDTAGAQWPTVGAIRDAHRLMTNREFLASADRLRRAARETTPQDAVELWLAAAHVAARDDATASAASDLARAATYHFASPQSFVAQALWRRAHHSGSSGP